MSHGDLLIKILIYFYSQVIILKKYNKLLKKSTDTTELV